jgi:hypothetical protein
MLMVMVMLMVMLVVRWRAVDVCVYGIVCTSSNVVNIWKGDRSRRVGWMRSMVKLTMTVSPMGRTVVCFLPLLRGWGRAWFGGYFVMYIYLVFSSDVYGMCNK